jgi:hypothetical protein
MGKWLTGGVQKYYTPQVSGLSVEYKIIGVRAVRHG